MRIPPISRYKPFLVALGWATATATLTLDMIFQGLLLPRNINGGGLYAEVVNPNPLPLVIFYAGSFVTCILAAAVVSDLGTTLVLFFPSFIGAAIITYIVLALPDFLGCCSGVLQASAVNFAFVAFFPILFMVNLAGTFVGIVVAEHWL